MYPFQGAAGTRGLAPGILAVAAFSLTLPLTRAAVPTFGAFGLSAVRAALAGIAAGFVLLAVRAKIPEWRHLPWIVAVALGTTIGFPGFAAASMGRAPASHGAVVLALVPLLTALLGSLLARERPSRRFWAASVLGSVSIAVFAARRSHAGVELADLLLVGAAVSAAIGYAAGGVLAKELGGAKVICWALVLCLPLSVPAAAYSLRDGIPPASPGVLAAVLYLALVSQLTGFFLWNHALAVGGIARVSQTQLLQCFLTLAASAVLLHEPVPPDLVFFALVTVACVFVGRTRPRPSTIPVKGTEP